MRKRRLVALLLGAGLVLSGCSADPKEQATDECSHLASAAKYRDDPAPPEVVEIVGLAVNAVKSDHPVFSISGTTEVTYPGGATDSLKWSCFAQQSNGRTYADIQYAILQSSGKSSTD